MFAEARASSRNPLRLAAGTALRVPPHGYKLLIPRNRLRKWLQGDPMSRARRFINPAFARERPFPPRMRRWPTSVRNGQLRLLGDRSLGESLEWWAASGVRHGLEYRYPLLDRRVLELALSLPPEQFRRGSSSRWLMRHALALGAVLPPEVCWHESKSDPARFDAASGAFLEALPSIRRELAARAVPPDRARYIDMPRLVERLEDPALSGRRRRRFSRPERPAIEHLVAEVVEEIPVLAEDPVERGDLPGGEAGDLPGVHVGKHLVVPALHRQAPAQVQIVQLRDQRLDLPRHPLRLGAHRLVGEEHPAVPAGFDVAALAGNAVDDVSSGRLFQAPSRPCGPRQVVPPEPAPEAPADPLADRVRVAHHEQEPGVAEMPGELADLEDVLRRFLDEHRCAGVAGAGEEIPCLAGARPVVAARIGEEGDAARLGGPDGELPALRRDRPGVAGYRLALTGKAPDGPAGRQCARQEGGAAVVRADDEEVGGDRVLRVAGGAADERTLRSGGPRRSDPVCGCASVGRLHGGLVR